MHFISANYEQMTHQKHHKKFVVTFNATASQ